MEAPLCPHFAKPKGKLVGAGPRNGGERAACGLISVQPPTEKSDNELLTGYL